MDYHSTGKRIRTKATRARIPRNKKGKSAKDGTVLTDKLDLLRDATHTLWKEVQSLGATVGVMHIEQGIDFYDEVRHFEVNLILRALEQTGGNQTRAAHLLGIKLTTLNAMIKRYHIKLSEE